MMPEQLAKEISEKLRKYITRVSFEKVTIWTHCAKLVYARIILQDVVFQNIALLILRGLRFTKEFNFDMDLQLPP